jgi:hypothetical protein
LSCSSYTRVKHVTTMILTILGFRHKQLQDQLKANFFGVVNVTTATLPHFRKRKSDAIAFIGSIHLWRSTPGIGCYAVRKHALTGTSLHCSYSCCCSNFYQPTQRPFSSRSLNSTSIPSVSTSDVSALQSLMPVIFEPISLKFLTMDR